MESQGLYNDFGAHIVNDGGCLVILEHIIHCNFALDCRIELFKNVQCLNE